MNHFIIIFIAFLLFQNGIFGEREKFRPVVTTPLGQIEGHVGLTVNMNPFYKFEGVPYAKPPIGELRFEDPQDVEPWTGIWKANVLTRCIQYDHFLQDFQKNYVVHGDEDCLHVNIYTHSTSQTANLDVLVHIHGGAFMFGRGANYGPEIIMDRNIVFVNFNYRLGPLGFLSTEDDELPGNTGLKDQIKALKWIKENIKYFGGNPEAITIHGLSAGGASVHFHYLLPESKGLFNQGISQSGCVLNPWVLVENIRERTAKVADLVGCPTGNSIEIKKCLKTKPARHIVQTVKEFQPFLYNPFSPFGVVVDGQWATNPVLPDHPYNLLKQGKVADLPWIISYTSAEGLYPAADFWANEQYLIDIDTKWNEIMPFILHYNDSIDPDLRDEISQEIREHYLGDKPVNGDTYSTLVDILSDRLFVADIEKAARLHSASVKSNVFSYYYNYRGSTSLTDPVSGTTDNIGVSHGDDTLLILKIATDFPKNELSTEADQHTSKLLVDITTSFMKEGSPNATSSWTPLSKNLGDPYSVLLINSYDDLQLLQEKSIGQSEFWEIFPFQENNELFSIISDRLFVADLETSAKLQNAAVKSNIYSYKFDYKGASSKSNLRTKSNTNIGTSHGDDTIYVLSTDLNTVSTEKDRQMSKIMIDMFISFMQSRTPNVTTEWQPLKKSEDELYYQLKISGPQEYEMEFKDEIGQRKFWDNLPFKENHNFNSIFVNDEL